MGEEALSKIQIGLESSAGTAVAADTILLAGEHPPISPDRVPELIRDAAGVRSFSVRNAPRIDIIQVRDTLTFPHAYFQMLPLFFSLGVKGNITPVEQTGSEGDMLWTFDPNWAAGNVPDSATIELGDNVQAYEAEYMQILRYRMAGSIGQEAGSAPFVIDNEYYARQLTKASFTGGLSIPSTTEINSKLMRFYQDTSWANIGNTEKTGLLRAWEIELLTGMHAKNHAGANKFFDTVGEGTFMIIARLTLEGNSDAVAIADQFDAGTKTFLQFNLSGPQIGAGDNHNLTLSASGFWMDVVRLSEKVNGNNLYSALFHGSYDLTGAQEFELAVTTDVAAI